MRRGRHARDDRSFARSAGTAMGRGLALLGVAVLLGVVLLREVDDPDQVVRTGGPETTLRPRDTATTSLPRLTTTTIPPVVTRPARDVRVLTANGTTVRGAGSRIKDRLLAAQYNALAATDTRSRVTASAVYFTPGYAADATAIAQLLGLAAAAAQPLPTPLPVPDLRGANVLVVVGPDLAGAPPTDSTTTTTRRTTTTRPPTTTTTRAPASTTTSTTR